MFEWTECSEKLPSKSGLYLITIEDKIVDGDVYVVTCIYDDAKREWGINANVIAWMPAIEPYRRLPPAQGKPFNLPKIYIADGCDTIEGEDGNVGFGVYVPDENQIYVAGDVEGEIRARALLHEICHWVQAMCGRPFDEDEANEFSDIIYDALPSAQPEIIRCKDCIYYDPPHVENNGERIEYSKIPEDAFDVLGTGLVHVEYGINIGGRCLRDYNVGYSEDKRVFVSETNYCGRAERRTDG